MLRKLLRSLSTLHTRVIGYPLPPTCCTHTHTQSHVAGCPHTVPLPCVEYRLNIQLGKLPCHGYRNAAAKTRQRCATPRSQPQPPRQAEVKPHGAGNPVALTTRLPGHTHQRNARGTETDGRDIQRVRRYVPAHCRRSIHRAGVPAYGVGALPVAQPHTQQPRGHSPGVSLCLPQSR